LGGSGRVHDVGPSNCRELGHHLPTDGLYRRACFPKVITHTAVNDSNSIGVQTKQSLSIVTRRGRQRENVIGVFNQIEP